eukprot:TRINITY_DN7569_c0_g1_i1.p1 TRINITY_DN7569_c0_g1~~TRINITY_DN7569_c0_g1_i1.p1  ORF type:complete len:647 (+),score=115.84 TRINITY_DN7569_c0_g1_i1:94-2034(+)
MANELVPFATDGQVVLYTKDSSVTVVYNAHERTLRVRQADACPVCHRPLKDEAPHQQPSSGGSVRQFAPNDSEYFRLLAAIDTGSNASANVAQDDFFGERLMNRGYFERFFIRGRRIGSGAFGSVYLCTHHLEDVQLGTYAVKMVPIGVNRTLLLSRIHEVTALERVRHPNIVQYKHSWLEQFQTADFGPSVPCLFILMEYADSGNLADHIWPSPRHPNIMTDDQIWKFFLDILLGLHHLHSVGIVHRDLKPQNLLLTNVTDSPSHTVLRVLISDFGTSALLNEIGGTRQGNTGTVHFMAPELLHVDPDGSFPFHHTFQSDIWGLGVVLHAMAYNSLPFDGEDNETVMQRILRGERAKRGERVARPSGMMQLIDAMLNLEPGKRPLTGQILSAPVIQQMIATYSRQETDTMRHHTRERSPLAELESDEEDTVIVTSTSKSTALIVTPSGTLPRLSPPPSPARVPTGSPTRVPPTSPKRTATALPLIPVVLPLEQKSGSLSPVVPLSQLTTPPMARTIERFEPLIADRASIGTHIVLMALRLLVFWGVCEFQRVSTAYVFPLLLCSIPLVVMAIPSRRKSVTVATSCVVLQAAHSIGSLLSVEALGLCDCAASTAAVFPAILFNIVLLMIGLVVARKGALQIFRLLE